MRAFQAFILCMALPATGLVTALPAEAGGSQVTTIEAERPAVDEPFGQFADGVASSHPGAPDVFLYAAHLQAGGNPVPGRQLTFQRKLSGTAWKDRGTEATDSGGDVAVIEPVKRNAKYRFVFDGANGLEPSTSNVLVLEAMRDLNAAVAERAHRVRLSGDVNPGWAIRPVTLQRGTCAGPDCTWTDVRVKRSDADGRWHFRVKRPGAGAEERVFRAWIPAAGGFVDSFSGWLIVSPPA